MLLIPERDGGSYLPMTVEVRRVSKRGDDGRRAVFCVSERSGWGGGGGDPKKLYCHGAPEGGADLQALDSKDAGGAASVPLRGGVRV